VRPPFSLLSTHSIYNFEPRFSHTQKSILCMLHKALHVILGYIVQGKPTFWRVRRFDSQRRKAVGLKSAWICLCCRSTLPCLIVATQTEQRGQPVRLCIAWIRCIALTSAQQPFNSSLTLHILCMEGKREFTGSACRSALHDGEKIGE